ncbi:MAG: hemagglutinin repeat-containing protein, partial [Rhodobacterales bacterium]
DFNRSHGQSELFTNAAITAGADLDIISGLDTVILGGNLKARDIYMDVGQDLVVHSRQNTSTYDSFGFGFSVTFTGTAITGLSLNANFSDANRKYTDNPATIVAQDRLSIYTGRNTYSRAHSRQDSRFQKERALDGRHRAFGL